jgi:hypothetical protein
MHIALSPAASFLPLIQEENVKQTLKVNTNILKFPRNSFSFTLWLIRGVSTKEGMVKQK